MINIIHKLQEKQQKKAIEYKEYLIDDRISKMKKMGKVEIKENEIICHVSQQYIEKTEKKAIFENKLDCMGLIEKINIKNQTVNIGKKCTYEFDGVTFSKRVRIVSPSSNIIIKNSNVNSLIKYVWADHLILENNKYNFNSSEFAVDYKYAINCETNDSITIIHDTIKNTNSDPIFGAPFTKPKLDINLNSKKINIIDSVLDIGCGIAEISTENLKVEDSPITAAEVYIDADNIVTNNSLINYTKGIVIYNKNESKAQFLIQNLKDTQISNVFYNNIIIFKKDTHIFSLNCERERKRFAVLEALKKVNDTCVNSNGIILKKFEQQLNSQKVNQIIKRK